MSRFFRFEDTSVNLDHVRSMERVNDGSVAVVFANGDRQNFCGNMPDDLDYQVISASPGFTSLFVEFFSKGGGGEPTVNDILSMIERRPVVAWRARRISVGADLNPVEPVALDGFSPLEGYGRRAVLCPDGVIIDIDGYGPLFESVDAWAESVCADWKQQSAERKKQRAEFYAAIAGGER